MMPMGPPPGHSPVATGPGPSAVPLAPAPPQQMAMDDPNSNDGRKAKRELSQSKRAAQNRAAQVSLFLFLLSIAFFPLQFLLHLPPRLEPSGCCRLLGNTAFVSKQTAPASPGFFRNTCVKPLRLAIFF